MLLSIQSSFILKQWKSKKYLLIGNTCAYSKNSKFTLAIKAMKNFFGNFLARSSSIFWTTLDIQFFRVSMEMGFNFLLYICAQVVSAQSSILSSLSPPTGFIWMYILQCLKWASFGYLMFPSQIGHGASTVNAEVHTDCQNLLEMFLVMKSSDSTSKHSGW